MLNITAKKKSRKAQTETMGLAIIVVLVSVIMLFAIKFSVFKEPSETKKDYTHGEIASNLLGAMLKTTVQNCKGYSVTELLQDCGSKKSIDCEDGFADSCDTVGNVIQTIFHETLEAWNKDYYFKAVSSLDANPILTEGNNCPGEKRLRVYPIPLNPGTLVLELSICE